jgi:hypothetical protein
MELETFPIAKKIDPGMNASQKHHMCGNPNFWQLGYLLQV